MKLDAPRRKIADDALDLYTPVCTVSSADSQIMQLPIGRIKPYHNHPFHEYTGDRLNDMVESISKHGILVPVIVQPLDSGFYEMLAGHNRMNAASLAGLDTVPAIVKEGLTADEAYYYVIETNVLQRSFSELMPSEQAAVLGVHYSTMISQGKRSDIDRELQLLSGNGQEDDGETPPARKNSRNALAEQYSLSSARVARLLRLNSLIPEFRERVDNGKRYWARVMVFTPVPVNLLEIVCGKRLDNPYQSISAIYDTHNRILAERKRVQRQEKYEQHQWKLMVRRAIKDQHEQERMNAPMEEPCAPDYIANHAKHPFSGGAMCPR